MGVFGLQTYAEKACPDVAFDADIAKLANSWKGERNPTKKPKVIVDLMACMRPMYGNLDLICGGQGMVYFQRWKAFIEAFEAAGIELVFVKDGPINEEKRHTWVERRYKTVTSYVNPVFDCLGRGEYPPDSVFSGSCALPAIVTEEIVKMLHNNNNMKNEVITSTPEKDADQLMAELADEDTLAILSNDSDFLIYQYHQDVLYLSIRHFDFDQLFADKKTLKTKGYNRQRLAHCLHLAAEHYSGKDFLRKFEVGHLPLFATLRGNDVISFKELFRFQNWIMRRPLNSWVDFNKVCGAIAFYILNERLPPHQLTMKELKKVAKDVFEDGTRFEVIRVSIDAYFLHGRKVDHLKDRKTSTTKLSEEEIHWQHLVSIANCSNRVKSLMSGYPNGISTLLEDFRNEDIPATGKLFQKNRQRVAGILLHEKPSRAREKVEFTEWCMTGLRSLEQITVLEVIPAPDCHPGLEALWNDDDRSLDDVRWRLFAHMVSPQLDHEAIKNLEDPTFLYPVCQLFMMQHEWENPILFAWEVELFLLEHVHFQQLTDEDFLEISRQRVVPDPRGVQLATLYTRSRLEIAAKSVGNIIEEVKILPLLSSFDGIHFQQLYKRCKPLKSVAQEAIHHEKILIKPFFDLVTSGGVMVKC